MIDASDAATGLPPLDLDTSTAFVPMVGRDGGEGIVGLPDGTTIPIRYVNVRGVISDRGPTEWVQMTLAFTPDVAAALLAALA